MKKLLTLAAATAILALPVGAYAVSFNNNDHEHQNKVTVCHPTKSETHPFTVITVNENGVQSKDFAYTGPFNSDHKGDPTWCANNQPGDMCANIDGKQAEVPEGMVKDDKGNCAVPPVVVPPPTVPTVVTDNTPVDTTFHGK